jgi:hypothetical protein
MRMTLPGAPRKVVPRPAPVGPGRLRKVGIIGGAPRSLAHVPWQDPTWEFWAHSSCVLAIPYLRCDRLFDLHPKHCFMEAHKNGFRDYYAFLQRCPTPVYMQAQFEAIPSSVRYPREVIKALWPGVPHGSQTSWMTALALYEGVTHLGYWGVDYAHETEYQLQRSNAEQWVGIARGLGVHIVLPADTPFCQEPVEDYAYESHATPEKYEAIKRAFAKAKAQNFNLTAFDKTRLQRLTPDREAEAARIRAAKQPQWVKEVAKFGPDTYPEWLAAADAAARGRTRALSRQRASEIKRALGQTAPAPAPAVPRPPRRTKRR